MKIKAIICKPTRACNADCRYCCAPPYDKASWTIDTFYRVWDELQPHLAPNVQWIWHGGEPMMLSPDFYRQATDYAYQTYPSVQFSMQSNILLYKRKRWQSVIQDCFKSRISTSFELPARQRTINGNAERYHTLFRHKIDEMINDGFRPGIIATLNEQSAADAMRLYELSKQYGQRAVNLKFNYMYPAGRLQGDTPLITPQTYTDTLLTLYTRWRDEHPPFEVAPLSEMLQLVLGKMVDRCPWTRQCGGQFLAIEPNGDLYNCSAFADLREPEFCYGNIFTQSPFSTPNTHTLTWYPRMQASTGFKQITKRRHALPVDCTTCDHFTECQGGCQRDAYLFKRGLSGKFYYCDSWKSCFSQIKADVASGRATPLIRQFWADYPGPLARCA